MREELRFWGQRLEEHASQHSAGIMEDCLRVFKSIAALVEVFYGLEARNCMALGVLCRKSDLSIFGLVEAERCQLEFCQLCAGASWWPEYLGLGEAERCQFWL